MALPPVSRLASRGVTLIEILMVVAIMTLVGGTAAFIGLDSFRGFLFRSDRDVLVTLLQHVRAEAMGNICRGTNCTHGESQGIEIMPDAFLLFQGGEYVSRDTSLDLRIDANPLLNHTGTTEIIFTPVSGTTTGGAITFTSPDGHESVVTVDTEGQIAWTN